MVGRTMARFAANVLRNALRLALSGDRGCRGRICFLHRLGANRFELAAKWGSSLRSRARTFGCGIRPCSSRLPFAIRDGPSVSGKFRCCWDCSIGRVAADRGNWFGHSHSQASPRENDRNSNGARLCAYAARAPASFHYQAFLDLPEYKHLGENRGADPDGTYSHLIADPGSLEGHGGSHPHLVHEFVSALIEDRDPFPNAVFAANITCTGILAHQSALTNGERLRVPDFRPVVTLLEGRVEILVDVAAASRAA